MLVKDFRIATLCSDSNFVLFVTKALSITRCNVPDSLVQIFSDGTCQGSVVLAEERLFSVRLVINRVIQCFFFASEERTLSFLAWYRPLRGTEGV